MRAYGIPDVDLLVSLYEHSTVRMAPNDPQWATIAFDTGVAQGSALSPLLFLVFMNALLGLITDRGRRLRVSHGLKCGVQVRKKGRPQERVCCLLVLNLVSSTLSCIRRPRPRLRVLDVCGFV